MVSSLAGISIELAPKRLPLSPVSGSRLIGNIKFVYMDRAIELVVENYIDL